MLLIYTLWWCLTLVVLQLALVLPTSALSDNETTDGLALQILSVSPTAVNVQWNCTRDNLTLQWKATVKNAVEKWERKDKKVIELCQNASIGQQVNTVIADLEEGVEYHLSLTQFEATLSLSSLNFNTLTSVPSGPPIYVRGHSVNPAGLHISWSRPKLLDCNGDILQYIIVVDNGLDIHNYTLNVTSECVSRTCTNIECMSHSFTVSEMDELIPHRKYSVKVAAINVNGTGPFSSAIGVMSGDDEPGPPENLRVINSDEESDVFVLQWDMPRNPNGAIIGYKIEYGVTNDTTASDYTHSMNYTLELLSNETYTIAVCAENFVGIGRAVQIQWSSSDDGSSSSNNIETYNKYIIIGSSAGAFVLILLVCTIIVYIRAKHKKSSKSLSKSSQFYPAEVTTVVNLGYIYAERGSNSLPYDYPYIEANGAQALSTTTFHAQIPTKSSIRNSTSTCGYIEMSTVLNGNPKSHPASHSVLNSPSNIPTHPSIVSTSYQYVNANHVPGSQNDARALLSPPADDAGVSTKANTHSDNGYVTLRS